jgi:hypothetical protein
MQTPSAWGVLLQRPFLNSQTTFPCVATPAFRIDSLMTQQQTLFSQGAPVPPQSPEPSPEPNPDQPPGRGRAPAPRQTPLWLVYLELSVRVVVRLYLGLVLVVLPWTPFWANNHLLLIVPHLPFIALSGVTRGIVSGLGLLNIWIGVTDAIHYKQS